MNTEPARLPVVDLHLQNGVSIAAAIDAACADLGFFFLIGHGVQQSVVAAAYEEATMFFAAPLEEKLAVARPHSNVSRGYNSIGDQRHAATFAGAPGAAGPDLQESFAIGVAEYAPNLWPMDRGRFRSALLTYYSAMEALATRLMGLFAVALNLPPEEFRDKIDRHASILRAVCYPEPPAMPFDDQLRAGPHTDFGTLTILRIDDAPGGLQVRDRDGKWLEVGALPGAFVVNIGDLMQRWTNDRWISSIHRVVNPRDEEAPVSRRLSLVFFHEPNPDAVVSCLPTCETGERPARYPDVVAAEYRQAKVAALRGVGIS